MSVSKYQPTHGSKFICFEGGEGSGKTTQIRRVGEQLRDEGYRVLTTREPGGSAMAEAIRAILCSTYDEPLCPNTTTLLMYAGRNQHIQNTILPALANNTIVLCDRYVISGYALQVVGDGGDTHLYEMLSERALELCKPDHTFIFDVSVSVSRERSRKAGRGGIERYDMMNDVDRRRVHNAYLSFLAFPHHSRIDAERPEEVITHQLVTHIKEVIETGTLKRPTLSQLSQRDLICPAMKESP